MECSSTPKELELLVLHKYRLYMMVGTVLEVQITGFGYKDRTFYCKSLKGRAKKILQFYFWDVEEAEEIS